MDEALHDVVYNQANRESGIHARLMSLFKPDRLMLRFFTGLTFGVCALHERVNNSLPLSTVRVQS